MKRFIAAADFAGERGAAKPSWSWVRPRSHRNTVIAQANDNYVVQNASVALLDSGDLAVVLSHNRYTSDAVIEDIAIQTFVSGDGGESWQRGGALPAIYGPVVGNCPRRAVRLSDGSLAAVGSRGWENFEDTPAKRQELSSQGYYFFSPEEGNAKGVISIIRRAWVSRSADNGRTWQTSDINLPFFTPHLACYGDCIVLRDGAFIQPMWGRLNLKLEPKYVSSLVLRSEDGGKRWDLCVVARAGDCDFNETSVAQAPNGDLVALIRTTGQRELWTAVSKDEGKTWSEPRDSGLLGSTPWVVATDDHLVVAVYIRRETTPPGGGFPSTGVYGCVSRDNGQTWDAAHQACLFDAGTEFVDGYPSAVALPDGSVYAVYGFHGARAIGGVRFHPRFRARSRPAHGTSPGPNRAERVPNPAP
jgi:hypothetical protein